VLARDRECLLVALPDLLGGNALLEAVVAGEQQVVDLRSRGVGVDGEYLTFGCRTIVCGW
jgi:hypothetical protein